MAQLAVAWVLQNDNVAAALVGASRPEQVAENVKAAGVKLDADVMSRIDDALGAVVVRDPAKTAEGHAEDPRRLRRLPPTAARAADGAPDPRIRGPLPPHVRESGCVPPGPGCPGLARASYVAHGHVVRRPGVRRGHRRDLSQPAVDVDVRLR